MRHASPFTPFLRAHPLAKIAIAVCLGLSCYTFIQSLAHPDAHGDQYTVLLSENLFGYHLVPAFLLSLGFGATRFSAFERARSIPRHETALNLLWIAVCAACATVPPLAACWLTAASGLAAPPTRGWPAKRWAPERRWPWNWPSSA